jgi:hypothetical protein
VRRVWTKRAEAQKGHASKRSPGVKYFVIAGAESPWRSTASKFSINHFNLFNNIKEDRVYFCLPSKNKSKIQTAD